MRSTRAEGVWEGELGEDHDGGTTGGREGLGERPDVTLGWPLARTRAPTGGQSVAMTPW